MAAAASTCSLASPSTTLLDGGRTHLRRQPPAPHCVSLPTLPPPIIPHFGSPQKAIAYCRRIARNIVSMATGDVVIAETTVEVTTEAPEIETTATGESEVVVESTSEAATELPEIVKTIQAAWDKVEDKYAVSSLAFAGGIFLWGTSGMISAINELPLVPGVFEFVGIGYTGWFAYRNLIFKPEREALIASIKNTYQEIIG